MLAEENRRQMSATQTPEALGRPEKNGFCNARHRPTDPEPLAGCLLIVPWQPLCKHPYYDEQMRR